MAVKAASKPTALPPPLANPNQPIKDQLLRAAIALYDGLVAQGDPELFLLPPAEVHANLAANLELNGELQQTARGQKGATARVHGIQRDGEMMQTRLEQLVNGAYPYGSIERAAFFPSGPGLHSLAERLAAMADGIKRTTLPKIPTDLGAGAIAAMAERLGAAVSEQEAQQTKRLETSATRAQVEAKTRSFHSRSVSYLRGYFGRTSPELAKFGIKPISLRHRATKRKTKPETNPTSKPT